MAHSARFSEALSAHEPKDVVDQKVIETENLVVVPTVGMILPNWFLLVPKAHSINFVQQDRKIWAEACDTIHALSALVNETQYIVFEHGAVEENSLVGCGLDHAHLHILFGNADLIAKLWLAMGENLSAAETQSRLIDIPAQAKSGSPYYFAWHNGSAMIDESSTRHVSQRLRRVVAEVAGCPEKWDYRQYTFRENIEVTLKYLHERHLIAA